MGFLSFGVECTRTSTYDTACLPALVQSLRSKVSAQDRANSSPNRVGVVFLGQLIVEVWAILITDRTYACAPFSRYPVISATREKKACLNGLLIVQFTGTVWNPFSSSNGPVFHRGRGW